MKSLGVLLVLVGLFFAGLYVVHVHQDEVRSMSTSGTAGVDYDGEGNPIEAGNTDTLPSEERDRREQYEVLVSAVCLIAGAALHTRHRRRRRLSRSSGHRTYGPIR